MGGSSSAKVDTIGRDVEEEIRHGLFCWARYFDDRDRGTPRDATPPTPPGIRVRTNGGSTELGLGGRIDSGKTERLEIVVA
jgi:hypothetical protein